MSLRLEIHRHQPGRPWTYFDLDQRQREIAKKVREGEPGALILSEVAPVITLGRRTQPGDIWFGAEELKKRGVDLYSTDRGGLATYHGPGQWILFPVDRLEKLADGNSRGVRKITESLLEIALEVGKRWDSTAEIRKGCETGVWTRNGKFASVGLHIEDGVLLHGLAVNGFQTELSFSGFRPCGLDAGVDYLLKSKETGLEKNFLEIKDQILNETKKNGWLDWD